MKERSEPSLSEFFSGLSDEGRKLLMSMYVPPETGLTKETIADLSEIGGRDLDSAMEELNERGLLESGVLEEGQFVVGEGDRYRLPLEVCEQVLRIVFKP